MTMMVVQVIKNVLPVMDQEIARVLIVIAVIAPHVVE